MITEQTENHVSQISILVVDDHEVVRVGLRSVLGRLPHLSIVGEVGTGKAAVAEAKRLHPSIVLLDVQLPDQYGVDVCREIRSSCPQTRVVFLTSYPDEAFIRGAAQAGAHGYVLKEIGSESLLESLDKVARGQSLLELPLMDKVFSWMKSEPQEKPKVRRGRLSRQEERVMHILVEGKTNKEIAKALGLSPRTVQNYVSHIFEKLQVARRSQATALYAKGSMN